MNTCALEFRRLLLLVGGAASLSLPLEAQDPVPFDRHRFHTDRESPVELGLPAEDDAFTFAIFGDRTGGPAEGVKILAQAVGEVNLLDPDLVMTVGDMIDGYNRTPEWMAQMREFKGIMDGLTCHWFPVAGNHDTYWRGPAQERPPEEHEGNYELHFGPLWYAFEHKDAWFVVLYSDEPDPATGERNFSKPGSQVMSPRQYAWLEGILEQAGRARHTFVFLHHPRWIGGGYGDDWERVHQLLARAGNVRAVFAGHIHYMRYDGKRDGIEYFALATTGGGQSELAPKAGFLHHYNYVTVRDEGISMVTYPVGASLDPRAVTAQLSADVRKLSGRVQPRVAAAVDLETSGAVDGTYQIEVENPVLRPVEYQLVPSGGDASWRFFPEHLHVELEPGEKRTLRFRALRSATTLDTTFREPRITVAADYLAETHRISMKARSFDLPLRLSWEVAPERPAGEHVLEHGEQGVALLHDSSFELPDGPLTLEGWLKPAEFSQRQGWLAKTESSEFGIFVNGGVPEFLVFLDGSYRTVKAPGPVLELDRWQHLAGVFDGEELRLYLDGERIGAAPASGERKPNALPLVIGGDVNGSGDPVSTFRGKTDEVRLSSAARYSGERFEPQRRLERDAETVLLLHMDGAVGTWLFDSSGQYAHPRLVNGARVAPAE